MKSITEILQDKYVGFEYHGYFIRAINIFCPYYLIFDSTGRLVYQSKFKSFTQVESFIDKNLYLLDSLCEKI